MNGHDLERLLSLVDENIEANEVRLRAEIIRFIQHHEDAVVDQLRAHKSATIPTSFGEFLLNLADLQNSVFNPVAA